MNFTPNLILITFLALFAQTTDDSKRSETKNDGFIEMVFVKGGTFEMSQMDKEGSLQFIPNHTESVNDFYIGKFEVTQKQWDLIMPYNPSIYVEPNNPVEFVSWLQAIEFCNKLSAIEGLEKCYTDSAGIISYSPKSNGYRLPTEAEWEYAEKGGCKSQNFEFCGSNDLGEVAWYRANSGGVPHQVGTKMENELGICDMNGNVWEWCWDSFDRFTLISLDIDDPMKSKYHREVGIFRVRRGFSFNNPIEFFYNNKRYFNDHPGLCYDDLGFRVVRNSIQSE